MKLRIGRATKAWACVRGDTVGDGVFQPDLYDAKVDADYMRADGESVERVLVTVERVERGKRK